MLVVIGVERFGGLLMFFETAPCAWLVCPGRARKYVPSLFSFLGEDSVGHKSIDGLGVRHPCLSTVLDRQARHKALCGRG